MATEDKTTVSNGDVKNTFILQIYRTEDKLEEISKLLVFKGFRLKNNEKVSGLLDRPYNKVFNKYTIEVDWKLLSKSKFVYQAVSLDGWFLMFANKKCKSDEKLIFDAIRTFPGIYKFIVKEFNDKYKFSSPEEAYQYIAYRDMAEELGKQFTKQQKEEPKKNKI